MMFPFWKSVERPAAIDDVCNARRESAFVAGEVHREQRDFFGRAEPAHRLAADEHLAAAGTCGGGAVQHRGVSMVPGQMQLQRTPLVMKSAATARVSAATAALVAP